MKYIKGVHRHGSETFLIVLKNNKTSNNNFIYKTATTEAGIKSIYSEYEGISWYNKQNKNKIKFDFKKNSNKYYTIKIKCNDGFFNIKSSFKNMLEKKYFDLTVNHYIQTWGEYRGKKYAPLHGDLSLVGNVMFNFKDEVLFVDWEQFEIKKNIPTGLDLVMMFLENIWYELKKSNKLDKGLLEYFAKSINILNEEKLISPFLLRNPGKNTLSFIKSNLDIWNAQHNKLPVLRLTETNVSEIDSSIAKLI